MKYMGSKRYPTPAPAPHAGAFGERLRVLIDFPQEASTTSPRVVFRVETYRRGEQQLDFWVSSPEKVCGKGLHLAALGRYCNVIMVLDDSKLLTQHVQHVA